MVKRSGEKTARGIASAGLVVGLAGCLADIPSDEPEPDTRAITLLEESEDRGYPSWDRPRGVDPAEAPAKAAGPHGLFVDVHLNPVLVAATEEQVEEDVTQWPAGAWAVALGYDDETRGEVALISIARKDETGWVWAQLTGDGEAIDAGRPGDCLGCHGGADDYVFSALFPEPGG